jgi:hypothetical protein
VTTIERCTHEHAWPAIECTGVRLTRARRVPVCMCGHPKTVHQHWRPGLDCGIGKCDCRHYESARQGPRPEPPPGPPSPGSVVAFWGAVGVGIVWPLDAGHLPHH